MHESFLHRHHQCQVRQSVGHDHPFAQPGVTSDASGAAHPERFALARDNKYQSDSGILQHVAEGGITAVSRPLWDGDRLAIQHVYKACRIALWETSTCPAAARE